MSAAHTHGWLVEKIKTCCTGQTEWRVQDPGSKAYCMSMCDAGHINPKREIQEWFYDHKLRHPNSMFAKYEIAQTTVFSRAEELALTAASEIERLARQRDELLEALRVCATQSVGPDWTPEQALAFIKQNARAAIEKVTVGTA